MADKPVSLVIRDQSESEGHDDPLALRAEIAKTRASMDATIEALHGRLNPTLLKTQALESFHEVTDSLKAAMKAELIEAKAALKAEIRDEYQNIKHGIADEISIARSDLRDATIGKVKHMIKDAEEEVINAGSTALTLIKKNAVPAALIGGGLLWLILNRTAAADESKPASPTRVRRTTAVANKARRAYRDNPIAFGVAVAAVGIGIGLAIPRTSPEDALLGETRDELIDKAGELAQAAVTAVTTVATEANHEKQAD